MSRGRTQSLKMRSRPSDDTSLHTAGTTAGTTLTHPNGEPGTDVVAGMENSCCKRCIFSIFSQNSVKRTDFFSQASLKRTKWLSQNAHQGACREKPSSRQNRQSKIMTQ